MTQETTTDWLPAQFEATIDEVAVHSFAHAMVEKMARSRTKGRGGWQTCSVPDLWQMLRDHVEKGDPVDVANLAMMIWHNQQRDADAEARAFAWTETNPDA